MVSGFPIMVLASILAATAGSIDVDAPVEHVPDVPVAESISAPAIEAASIPAPPPTSAPSPVDIDCLPPDFEAAGISLRDCITPPIPAIIHEPPRIIRGFPSCTFDALEGRGLLACDSIRLPVVDLPELEVNIDADRPWISEIHVESHRLNFTGVLQGREMFGSMTSWCSLPPTVDVEQ